MDFKKNIILPSRKIIAQDSKVKKLYFLPGVLSIIFLTMMLVYQSVYTYVIVAGRKNEAFQLILRFFEKDYFIEVVITSIIFLLLYIFLTPIFEGGLIKYISKRDIQGEKANISSSDVLGVGLFKFLPVFEYDQMFSKFRFLSILNFYLFTIRLVGIQYIQATTYVYLVILLFSMIINIFFSYSKFEIVLGNKKVFASIGSSATITILNLKTTVKLYFLIFILNFRVIFNFLILLLFPFLIAFAIGFISSQIFLWITIVILALLFTALIAIISYLSAVLEVFTTSLWYFAWKHGKGKLKEIDE
ncbi:hypothetical protein LR004_02180 [Candidatus Gracilibacteria bacterium]|nr:hypothetical protein [Candidatus Gracilibacteria bacterium]